MANVEVILREKLLNYGAEADVVKVRRGYARNFLIPQGKAYEATNANLRHVEGLKASRAAREASEFADAQALAAKIRKATINLKLSTGQAGKAFGSITVVNIVDAAKEQANIVLDRHDLDLKKPIKASGTHDIAVKLHPEVDVSLKVVIEAEEVEGADSDEESEGSESKKAEPKAEAEAKAPASE